MKREDDPTAEGLANAAPSSEGVALPLDPVVVGALLVAMRQRRRWSLAIVVTPLATAGAALGLLETGWEELVAPVVIVGAVAVVVEVTAAIAAGLEINRCLARLGANA